MYINIYIYIYIVYIYIYIFSRLYNDFLQELFRIIPELFSFGIWYEHFDHNLEFQFTSKEKINNDHSKYVEI